MFDYRCSLTADPGDFDYYKLVLQWPGTVCNAAVVKVGLGQGNSDTHFCFPILINNGSQLIIWTSVYWVCNKIYAALCSIMQLYAA